MLKLYKPFRNNEIFIISLFMGFESKNILFCRFSSIFSPLDPDLDSGSQNLADLTDPDPKHCVKRYRVSQIVLDCK